MPRKPSKYIGDDNANIFYGDAHRDIMEGNGGNDILVGAGGIDRLSGGDGEDILRGGADNDILQGGGGSDLIFGGAGDDSILAASGDDFVDGGKGTADILGISAAFRDVHIAEIGGVRTIATADGIITVRNVEFFRFSDGIKGLSAFNFGEPYFLVPSTDTLLGHKGRDFYLGRYLGPDEGGEITFDNRDHIDGGAGSDKLELVVSMDGSVTPSLESIETINVSVYHASFALDLVNTEGVKTLAFGRSTEGTFTAENVSSIVEMQLSNTISGTLAVEYAADVISGNADTQHVTINDAAGTISVAGVEIMNVVTVATTAASNRLTIDAADLHTLNIAGDAGISIDGLGMNTKTVDASLAIGGVELVFTHATGLLATGGEGDDVFDFSAVSDDAGDTSDFAEIDGGRGDDVVAFAGTLDTATATRDGEYTLITSDGATVKFRNIEMLKFADATILVRDLDNGPMLGEALF